MKGRTASSLKFMQHLSLWLPEKKEFTEPFNGIASPASCTSNLAKVVHSLLRKTQNFSTKLNRRPDQTASTNPIRLRSGENKIKNHYKNVPAIIEHYSMAFIKVSKKNERKKSFDVNRGSKKSEIICVSCCIMDDQSKRVMNHFSPLFESKPLQCSLLSHSSKRSFDGLASHALQSEGIVLRNAQFLVTLGVQSSIYGSIRVIVTLSPVSSEKA